MPWVLSDNLAEYAAHAAGLLRGSPVQNTVLLSVLETLRIRGAGAVGGAAPLFGWWAQPGGQVTAAFLHTPPWPTALTSMPDEQAAALAGVLASERRPLSGVGGDTAAAAAFAAIWERLTGDHVTRHMAQRLYRLGQLRPLRPAPPGGPRVAGPDDRDRLIAWFAAFHQEADAAGPGDGTRAVDDRLSYGGLTLWEAGGEAVSMAGLTRPAAGQVRVGPVYTPPEHRRRGYAGAVTAAVSRAARDAGATEVTLFTDLANPASNALYQRLGYEAVSDWATYSFGK